MALKFSDLHLLLEYNSTTKVPSIDAIGQSNSHRKPAMRQFSLKTSSYSLSNKMFNLSQAGTMSHTTVLALRIILACLVLISPSVAASNGDILGTEFEGDIDMRGEKVVTNSRRNLISIAESDKARKWLHRTVPFIISDDFSDDQKTVIYGAMKEIMGETCVKFIRRDHERDYLFIQKGKSCYSHVGHQGGRQNVTLRITASARTNCLVHGEVMHELMHALGFWHEQSRPDRDKYITILTNNMRKTARKEDFMKRLNAQDFGLPYDYSSIMHYPNDVFQKNPSAITILTKVKGALIGQRSHLSVFDKAKINILYKCNKAMEPRRLLNNKMYPTVTGSGSNYIHEKSGMNHDPISANSRPLDLDKGPIFLLLALEIPREPNGQFL